jgi:hypothetical protein
MAPAQQSLTATWTAANSPRVSEGFEHVITVKNDRESAIVLQAWQQYEQNKYTQASEVLLEIRPLLPSTAFDSRSYPCGANELFI